MAAGTVAELDVRCRPLLPNQLRLPVPALLPEFTSSEVRRDCPRPTEAVPWSPTDGRFDVGLLMVLWLPLLLLLPARLGNADGYGPLPSWWGAGKAMRSVGTSAYEG